MHEEYSAETEEYPSHQKALPLKVQFSREVATQTLTVRALEDEKWHRYWTCLAVSMGTTQLQN